MGGRSLRESFRDAFLGIRYVLKTERNMRIHLAAAVAAVGLSVAVGADGGELLLVLFAAVLVIIAEMLNTAVEAAIDVAAPGRHPLGLVAKNVAAGAVLVAALNALAVGYLVLLRRLGPVCAALFSRMGERAIRFTLVGLVLVAAAVGVTRFRRDWADQFGKGRVCGQTAFAFAAGTAISLLTRNALVATLALLIAGLVAYGRREGGFRPLSQVIAGALVGILATMVLFRLCGLW